MNAQKLFDETADHLRRLLAVMVTRTQDRISHLTVDLSTLKDKVDRLKVEVSEAEAAANRWGWIPVKGVTYKQRLAGLQEELDSARERMSLVRSDAQDALATANQLKKGAAWLKVSMRGIRSVPQSFYNEIEPIHSLVKFTTQARALTDQVRVRKLLGLVHDFGKLATEIGDRDPDPEEGEPPLAELSDMRGEPALNPTAPDLPQQSGMFVIPRRRDAAEAETEIGQMPLPMQPRPVENRPAAPIRSKRQAPGQLTFDFGEQGAKPDPADVPETPRIWLPVSASRTTELQTMGARLDTSASRKGSRLWIPVEERERFEFLVPLAFRREAPNLEFPPVRHNAVGQNLWSVFDRASWNHIRTTAYDRAGHRCQICGKQGGKLFEHLATDEERVRGGLVDAHEVWDWEIVDPANGLGVQRLKRLLVVCKDCHFMFHEGYLRYRASEVGIEPQAVSYINNLRAMINRISVEELQEQLARDNAKWNEGKQVRTWILDLSHLGNQDFMSDHIPTLLTTNRADLSPDMVAGLTFTTEDGAKWDAQDVHAVLDRVLARLDHERRCN